MSWFRQMNSTPRYSAQHVQSSALAVRCLRSHCVKASYSRYKMEVMFVMVLHWEGRVLCQTNLGEFFHFILLQSSREAADVVFFLPPQAKKCIRVFTIQPKIVGHIGGFFYFAQIIFLWYEAKKNEVFFVLLGKTLKNSVVMIRISHKPMKWMIKSQHNFSSNSFLERLNTCYPFILQGITSQIFRLRRA